MPRQYIYTSARRGLEPGKSGFCCVARDRDLPGDLQRELERLSRYEREGANGRPLIMRFLKVKLRSGDTFVLSRITDSGTDYSRRDNHLAHHLIVDPAEATNLPDPASLLLAWTRWLDAWDEPPRILGDRDRFQRKDLDAKRISQSPERKYPDLVNEQGVRPAILEVDRGAEYDVILAVRSALLALPAAQRWSHPFTNFLLTTDRPSHFTWSANWIGRPLPYDLSRAPVSQSDPSDKSPETDAPARETETADSNASAASKLRKLPPPVVEIPQELRPAKRPKPRWTPKRVARWVNASIWILGAVCIALGYLWYRDYQESSSLSERPRQEPSPESSPASAAPLDETALENLRLEWEELFQRGAVMANLERARYLASLLEQHGDPKPLAATQFISLARSQPADAPTPVPAWILAIEDPGVIELDRAIQLNLAPHQFKLAPVDFAEGWKHLFEDHPNARGEPLLDPNAFDPASIERRLRHRIRAVKSEALALPPSRRDNASQYLRLSQSAASDPQLQPLNEIGLALDQRAYIERGEDDASLPNSPLSYRQYLYEIFDSYMVVRFRAFNATTEFRLALGQASSRNFDTAMEAAKAMRRAFQFAEADDEASARDLQEARQRWNAVFPRDDLMKETLVRFAIERLESTRNQLVELASTLSPEVVSLIRETEKIERHIEELVEIARSASLDEEWIVIRMQNAQLPKS